MGMKMTIKYDNQIHKICFVYHVLKLQFCPIVDGFLFLRHEIGSNIMVYTYKQCVKVLKVYVSSPESHCLSHITKTRKEVFAPELRAHFS